MMEGHNTILLYGTDVLLEEDKGEIYSPGVYIQLLAAIPQENENL